MIVEVAILVTVGRSSFGVSLGDNIKASGKKPDHPKGHSVQEMLNIDKLSRGLARSISSRLAGGGGGGGSDI